MPTEPNTQAVEAMVPDNHVEPPARSRFTESPLPGEGTDRKLVLESGMAIRERAVIVDARADGVVTTATDPAAMAFTIAVSSALLDQDDKVVTIGGKPVIAPAHEIALTSEALGRLGSQDAVAEVIREAREVAAARAEMVFRGALIADQMFGKRS